MFDYGEWSVGPNILARGQLFINSVTLYDYDDAGVVDNDNYATVLDRFVHTSIKLGAQVKYQGSTIWFLPRSGTFYPRKHLI